MLPSKFGNWKLGSTYTCPTDSCRNHRILAESAGMGPESARMRPELPESTGMRPEWDRNPPEWDWNGIKWVF